jgi:DNA-directed RNA polymerase subunit alpha
VGELALMSEIDLMNIRNFGKKSLTEVKEKLNTMGLTLKDSDGYFPGEDDDEDED